MGEVKDLSGKEAIGKLQELVKSARICMFCTEVKQLPFATRPMSTQDVDDEGNLWFFSDKDSNKNMEIKQDDAVQLVFSNTGSSEFLSVYGHADIIKDQKKAEELWTPIAKAWFKDGVDDPSLTVIRVRPSEIRYWDTQHGKLVSMLKIAVSTVTGKIMDDGMEGKLNV